MKAKKIFISAGLVLSTVLGVSSNAQAADFTIDFTPKPADPKGDITLTSITQNGITLFPDTNLLTVQTAKIVENTPKTLSINSGAASTDAGDNATKPFPTREDLQAGNAQHETEIAAYLGNYNLNNIVDTEDRNSAFKIDVKFNALIGSDNRGLDSFFLFERGKNSDIAVQAIDKDGNLVGDIFKVTRNLWKNPAPNYAIDTTEVTNRQAVGWYGVSFGNLNLSSTTVLSGLRLIAEKDFNGPDFKVFAQTGNPNPNDIPEPATILGLGSVAALAFVRRRQMKKSSV